MNGRPILVSITLLGVASFGAPRDLQFLLQESPIDAVL